MTKDVCDCCLETHELKTYNVVNVETNFVVAIVELCSTCGDKMEQEGRMTKE